MKNLKSNSLLTLKNLQILLFSLVFLVGSNQLVAHQMGCDHGHDGTWDFHIPCDSPGTACEKGTKTGKCTTVSGFGYVDCNCVTSKKKRVQIGIFGAVIDNPPVENGMTTLSFFDHEEAHYVAWDGEHETVDVEGEFISGKMQLKFGSFADITRIPVQLIDVDFEIKNYVLNDISSGINHYTLNNDASYNIYYNAEKGYLFVDTYEDNPHFLLNNDLTQEEDVTFAFDAVIEIDKMESKMRIQTSYDHEGLSATLPIGMNAGMFFMLALLGILYFGYTYKRQAKVN